MIKNNSTIILTTKRLYLTIWSEKLLPLVSSTYQDKSILKYMPYSEGLDETGLKDFLKRRMFQQDKYGFTFWAVFLKETDEFIGHCGLSPIPEDDKLIQLGYLLNKDFWGKGYITEAAKACCDYGFNKIGLEKIIGLALPGNDPSKNVMLRLGFEYLGITNKFYDNEDNWHFQLNAPKI